MAPVLAAALTQIPEKLHYTYGRTIFGDLVSRPIPRALWSRQAGTTKGQAHRVVLAGRAEQRRDQSRVFDPSLLLLGLRNPGRHRRDAAFGVAARALFEYFLIHRESAGVQVLYSLALWFVLIGLRNSPVDTFVQVVFVVFPAWVALRVSIRREIRLRRGCAEMISRRLLEQYSRAVHGRSIQRGRRSGKLDFEAWFSARTETDRSWTVDETTWRFPYRYLPTIDRGDFAIALPTPLLGDAFRTSSSASTQARISSSARISPGGAVHGPPSGSSTRSTRGSSVECGRKRLSRMCFPAPTRFSRPEPTAAVRNALRRSQRSRVLCSTRRRH